MRTCEETSHGYGELLDGRESAGGVGQPGTPMEPARRRGCAASSRRSFVPQWPSDNNSVNHVRRRRPCGANSERLDHGLELVRHLVDRAVARAVADGEAPQDRGEGRGQPREERAEVHQPVGEEHRRVGGADLAGEIGPRLEHVADPDDPARRDDVEHVADAPQVEVGRAGIEVKVDPAQAAAAGVDEQMVVADVTVAETGRVQRAIARSASTTLAARRARSSARSPRGSPRGCRGGSADPARG